MRKMFSAVKRFMVGEAGATMAEYGLLLALIAVVVIAAAAVIGTKISSIFQSVAGAL